MRLTMFLMCAIGASIAGGQTTPVKNPPASQMSVEEAAAKLAEKKQAREAAEAAERGRMVTIKKGELDDLRAEIIELRKEVASLKAAQGPEATAGDAVAFEKSGPKRVETAAGLKYVLSIKVGVTRQQLVTYIAQHKDSYRIGKDVRQPGPDKQELIRLEEFRKDQVLAGITSNGVDRIREYKDVVVVVNAWELNLVNDVIVDMTMASVPRQATRSR